MIRTLCLITAIGLAPSTVSAQKCAAPAACAPRCCTPAENDDAAPAEKPDKGNFLRGPSTGQASGESRSFGIRGPALHIPEMRIALPTLELPSPVRFKRGAEMIFDQVRGPHSLAAVQDFGNLDTDASAPADNDDAAPADPIPPTPKCTPYYCPPACDPHILGATTERLEATLARLEMLEKELATLRSAAEQPQRRVEPAVPGYGAAKPVTSAPVTGSRPVSNRPSQYVQARYEEPAPTAVAESRTVTKKISATPKMGLSAPKVTRPAAEPDEFGAWSRSTKN